MNYDLLDSIVNLGFSIAVAGYLIWWITKKLNSKLDRIARSLDELNRNIDKLIEVIKYGRRVN